MSKLSSEVREFMVDKLAHCMAEGMNDDDYGDYYDLAIRGMKGLSEYTDLEVYEQFLHIYGDSWESPRRVVDPQLKALRYLKEVTNTVQGKQEVQTFIDRRMAELGGEEYTEVELDEYELQLKRMADQAKRELGL